MICYITSGKRTNILLKTQKIKNKNKKNCSLSKLLYLFFPSQSNFDRNRN